MTASGPQSPNARQLHVPLVLGLLGNFAVFAYFFARGMIPLLPPPTDYGLIGGGMAAASLVLLLIGFLVFKPRVPRRHAGQSPEAFMSDPEVFKRVMLPWIMWEGGGVIGVVGFAITGQVYPAMAALLALLALVLYGPRYFAEQ